MESSKSGNCHSFVCEICVESKTKNESFSLKGCPHTYCTDCIVKYVDSNLQENITAISCPVANCSGLLEPKYCRHILPQQVFDNWGNALCEALFTGTPKFNCPFKDCSALLIDDGGEADVRESECPYCNRLFCAQCKVAWHSGIECAEFQNLHEDEREREDFKLMKLAEDKKDGCTYINSRNCHSFVCEICIESKTKNESFSIKGCSHTYCTDCIVKYVDSKLQENITAITCPVANCSGLLEPVYCRHILPQQVFDNWGNGLCEALFPGTQKFYCPFKDCSALLIDDGGEADVRESECPYCNRLFCAQCKVAWHSGIECAEFQNLHEDEREREDIKLMKLAEDKKWNRCPNCRYYVEKKDGCTYIKCRCGYAFCYNCGTQLSTASHTYNCPKCKV